MDMLSTSVPTFASGQASVPSLNVKPEHAITYEIGPRYTGRKFEFSLTAYTNQLTDTMSSVQNGTIIIPGLGTVAAMVNNNIGSAYVRGIETFASWRVGRGWTVMGNYTYTRGLDTVANVPLRFIPPMFGSLIVRYSGAKDRWWVESSLNAVDRLRHHSPQDETDAGFSADPGFGSPSKTNPALRPNFQIPGYLVTNLRGGYKVWQNEKRSLELTADLNNLFNVHYREAYAQQELYAPGFGAAVGGRIRF
jgi:outer membrane receptor protein involved in Fe transport